MTPDNTDRIIESYIIKPPSLLVLDAGIAEHAGKSVLEDQLPTSPVMRLTTLLMKRHQYDGIWTDGKYILYKIKAPGAAGIEYR